MTQHIGQYRILEELGAGGMGVVYRALDTELQREVALKRLRSEFAASHEVLERFRNEAKLQGRLNHPNIAQLYSLVQAADSFCIVMEFVDGAMVKDLLPLEWQLAAGVVLQTLDALGYAHSLGVLHRDIKPENILVDRRGAVKVMDFGIAYAIGSQRMTREKSILGTIEYMSPERILGKPMDGRSDIYAAGILLFELVTGRLPFDLSNEYDVLRWHLEGDTPSVTEFSAAPGVLDAVIRRAMQKAPEDRYAACAEMAAHLDSLAAPSLAAAGGALQALVAGRARAARTASLNAAQCFAQAATQIAAGDLDAAEHSLRAELNRHPREDSLRAYHGVVSRAQQEAGLLRNAPDGEARTREILAWLRVVGAERAADRGAYLDALAGMSSDSPRSPIAELLTAREEFAAGSYATR
ncbi:MAG TPA: serine/threonine-protein kinase [Bryobacteraceae bacterium]|nr:serine/threonine-protein kinase [Bryobacteraceae bacterium]